MRVTEVPLSPAQGPRLVVWLIRGRRHPIVLNGHDMQGVPVTLTEHLTIR